MIGMCRQHCKTYPWYQKQLQVSSRKSRLAHHHSNSIHHWSLKFEWVTTVHKLVTLDWWRSCMDDPLIFSLSLLRPYKCSTQCRSSCLLWLWLTPWYLAWYPPLSARNDSFLSGTWHFLQVWRTYPCCTLLLIGPRMMPACVETGVSQSVQVTDGFNSQMLPI